MFSEIEDGTIQLMETKYYKIGDLKNMIENIKISDLKLIYLNISSLNQNMDKLINLLAVTNFTPDIIALTETKITTTVNLDFHPILPNYTFFNTPSTTASGGAGIFIRNSLKFILRNDLSCSKDALFETIWVDIFSGKNNESKCTIGVIYRHNGLQELPTFNEYLESVFERLTISQNKFYICGDFNIDTLKWEEFPIIADFIDTMISYNALMLINKPTRFPIGNQIGTPSILDHFYTNDETNVINNGLLLSDITDHLPFFVVIQSSLTQNVIKNDFLIRDYRNADAIEFNRLIDEFNPYLNSNTLSIDEKFQKLQEHIIHCIEKIIPLRKLTKREISFKQKP